MRIIRFVDKGRIAFKKKLRVKNIRKKDSKEIKNKKKKKGNKKENSK